MHKYNKYIIYKIMWKIQMIPTQTAVANTQLNETQY
jgi:hypothetical protein